ncbi:MAG: hypothetical protein JWM11_3977 [Planctomycetaceae bacterium]|nr:hypothetical protein [Planctomycetaceae bacterium]
MPAFFPIFQWNRLNDAFVGQSPSDSEFQFRRGSTPTLACSG